MGDDMFLETLPEFGFNEVWSMLDQTPAEPEPPDGSPGWLASAGQFL